MLQKRVCPHTGVVNFFLHSDRFLSAGSVVEAAPGRFVWRAYVPGKKSGAAPDKGSAERLLKEALKSEPCRQTDCGP